MKTEDIILFIWAIGSVTLLVLFIGGGRQPKDSLQDPGSYQFGVLIIISAWPIILPFIPFMLWSDYRQKKRNEKR